MIISIIGPSGSGKGTQARLLGEKLGLPAVSLGELLRQEKVKGTPRGKEIAGYIDQGKFVPSDLLAEILSEKVSAPSFEKGFILDGTPRKMEDIALLEKVLAKSEQAISLVIHLDTSRETTLSRIQQRIYKALEGGEKVRDDEALEAVKARLAEYERTIEGILDYFRKKGQLVRVDNEGEIEAVAESVWEEVRKRLPNDLS